MLALGLLLALVSGCSRETTIEPPRPTQDAAGSRSVEAQAALDALVSAVAEAGTDLTAARERAGAVAAPGARDLLGAVADNAAALRLRDVQLRYIDETTLPADRAADLGEGAWAGTVEVAYAYGGVDAAPTEVETEVVFVPSGDRAAIAAVGGADGRTPLWLSTRLAVSRPAGALVAVAGAGAGRYPRLMATAVRQVTAVLGRPDRTLVLEVPDSQEQLDRVVDAPEGRYDNIAAVTTTADGSLARGAPVRILVNPAVFDGLQPRGAQVVLTHESAHAATEAPFTSMPTWLLEGFADYVALADGSVPVQVAARQVLARVRAQGLPDGLPTRADLDPSASGLGATYEEAWLACRYLGATYGQRQVVAFYRAVDAGQSTQQAFRSVLGTTQAEFVTGWRRDVGRLARVAR